MSGGVRRRISESYGIEAVKSTPTSNASVLLAIECKASSTAVNSSKRLNNDVAALFQQRLSRSLGHTV